MILSLTKSPLIIAHRGASAVAPENTLVAFRRAIRDGADGVECDVRLARDNVPVIIHDANLKRTAFREEKVSDLTASELSQIDVGSWFNFKHRFHARRDYIGESIPTVAELFEIISNQQNQRVYLELKCEDNNFYRFARSMAKLVCEFNLQSRVVIKSFEHEALAEIKKILPRVCVAALFRPRPLRVLNPKKSLIKPTLQLAAEEISLHYSLASRRTIKKAHAADLRTVIWTADHPNWVKRAFELGIHAIITNNPARLLAHRDELRRKHK